MSSQDDLGMLWYGVSGVSFNPTDPAEVMLNTGITAPLLSDQPRALVAPQQTQTSLGPQQGTISYGDPTISQQNQMLYDPQTGDFITQTDYIYDSYDGYEEDTTGSNSVGLQTNHILPNSQLNEEELNALPKTKKPKVHQHPALKLKTPIAYQKDTDLNAIPIMKEGMAVCEKCGAIGVRHAFYGKERKYCSLACARPPSIQNSALTSKGQIDISKLKNSCGDDIKFCINSSISQPPGQDDKSNIMQTAIATDFKCEFSAKDPLDLGSFSKNSTDMFQNDADDSTNEVPSKSILGLSSSSSTPSPRATPIHLPPPVSKNGLSDSFQWEPAYLQDSDFSAASVKSFKHAPMSECWEQISPGMKVEVSCGEESLMKDAFWVATVIALYGYKAKLRFEGFVDDSSKDIWVDLCSEEVHPVGWCATQGKPLIPPKSIQFKYKDWKEFLMKRLTGARTLPTNFRTKVNESLKSRFRPGLNLEVVDKNRIAQMRVASVTKVIGKRIHLRYHGAPPDDNGFWCHEDAPIIHPVGWSREVGHEIVASQSYHEKCMEVAYDPDDATSDLFIDPNRSGYLGSTSDQTFSEGMKLEAIDPLNLSTICVATVMKVLSHNYLMIRIDSYDNDNTCSDWFCYHSSSTSIFPAGFCEMNDIRLTPPRGYEGQFSWFSYLTKTQAVAAPPVLFTREIPNHGFKLGMSIEATDLMDPRLVCVAKVKEVKGRLLKIHFDGWEDDFDQWVDCNSTDIYPVGWCNLVGYKLEGPRPTTVSVPFVQRKKITRGRAGRKGRPFGTRRGNLSVRGSENASPIHQPQVNQMFPSTARRGRKPRQRGSSYFSQPMRENHQNLHSDEYNFDQDSSNDIIYNSNEPSYTYRGKRGRPRRNPLKISNHQTRLPRSTRTAMPSYIQSEEDISDETSSGVASLAGSENSSEDWDVDHYNINPLTNGENTSDSLENNEKNTSSIISGQDTLNLSAVNQDTGYRENSRNFSVNFKSITDDSDLFGDESPNFECLLNASDDRLGGNLPLSDNSSDFQVSSSFDTHLDKSSPFSSSSSNSIFTSVTSTTESQHQEQQHKPPQLSVSHQQPPQSTQQHLHQQPPQSTQQQLHQQPLQPHLQHPPPQQVQTELQLPHQIQSQPQPVQQHQQLEQVQHFPQTQQLEQAQVQQAMQLQQQIHPLQEPEQTHQSHQLQQTQQIQPVQIHQLHQPLQEPQQQQKVIKSNSVLNVNSLKSIETNESLFNSNNISSHETTASTSATCDKFIPRMADSSNMFRGGGKIQPKEWSEQDVATFLRVNDCGAYCENFIVQNIDGSKFLKLGQNDVMGLTGMKVGPSLKIHDLIQQLLAIINPAQARYQATLLKRGLTFGKS